MTYEQRQEARLKNAKIATEKHKAFFIGMLKELEAHFGIEFPKSAKDYLRKRWTKHDAYGFYVRGGYGHCLEVFEKGTSDKPIKKLAYFSTPRRRDSCTCIDKRSAGKDWLLVNNIIKPNKYQLVSGIVSEYVLTSIPEGWIAPETVEEANKRFAEFMKEQSLKTQNTLKRMELL